MKFNITNLGFMQILEVYFLKNLIQPTLSVIKYIVQDNIESN